MRHSSLRLLASSSSLLTAVAALCFLGAGCEVEPCLDTTLSGLQADLLTPSCATASCHGGAAPSRGLDMNPGNTHGSTVGLADAVEPGWVRVAAGDTSASLLYQVLLEGVENTRRMPPGFSIDDCEAAAVRVWIEEGAQDN